MIAGLGINLDVGRSGNSPFYRFMIGEGAIQAESERIVVGPHVPYQAMFYRDKENENLAAQLNDSSRSLSHYPNFAGSTTRASAGELYIGLSKPDYARWHYGYIGEVIIYNKVCDGVEIDAIQNYLKEKWRL
jgi:hypothetical protein